MNVKKVARVLIPYAVVVAVVAVVLAFALPKAQYYAGGELIDASSVTGIAREEDGDPYELGWRLVALASGARFTDEQVYQVGVLIGGLFEEVRGLGMDIEGLKAQVELLRNRLREQESQAAGGPNGPPLFVPGESFSFIEGSAGDASPVRI